MSKMPYQLKTDPRRWYERVELDRPVRLVAGDREWITRLGDLSNGGCRLIRPENCALQVDDLVHVHVIEQETPQHAAPLVGRIARLSDRHLGVGFQSEDDPLRYGT